MQVNVTTHWVRCVCTWIIWLSFRNKLLRTPPEDTREQFSTKNGKQNSTDGKQRNEQREEIKDGINCNSKLIEMHLLDLPFSSLSFEHSWTHTLEKKIVFFLCLFTSSRDYLETTCSFRLVYFIASLEYVMSWYLFKMCSSTLSIQLLSYFKQSVLE